MILTCPECSARYVVDPLALLPKGRAVRCAKCKHSWKEKAPDIDIPLVNKPEDDGSAAVSGPKNDPKSTQPSQQTAPATEQTVTTGDDVTINQAARKKRRRPIPKGSNLPALQNHKYGSPLWGWYGLGAFIALIICGFLIFQNIISDIWPPSKILYHSLGMNNHALDRSHHDSTETESAIPLHELFKIIDIMPRKTVSDGTEILIVEGNVTNLTHRTLSLPLLKISLKNKHDKIVREWTFKSSAATISKEEKVSFKTSLPNPPKDATSISVTFAEE